MITLTVLSGPDAGSVFPLDHDAVVIGRGNDCTVMLHDSALGRRHCEIRREGGRTLLIDLGSKNGSFINNHPERVSTQVLKNRDEISIGKSRLRIEFQERKETPTASAIALSNSSARLLLRVIEGKDIGRIFALQSNVKHFSVGRGQEADFILEDRQVSRIHFTVEETPTGFLLIDSGSRNGTFVNDNPTRISRLELRGGEILRLADTRIQVEIAPLGDITVFAVAPTSRAPTQPSLPSAPPEISTRPSPQTASTPSALPAPSSYFWAAFITLMLAMASAVLLLQINETAFFASGPVAASHARWEEKCITCHPPWGVQSVNSTCGSATCHANVVQINGRKQDDCAACHPEHRGRNFNLAKAKDVARCWICHEATFSNRTAGRYYQQLIAPNIKGSVPFPLSQPLHADEPQVPQQSIPQQETGLRFAHTAHAKSSKQEDCLTCHQPLPGTVINALGVVRAFPSHEECIRCHSEVGDRDPEAANARASTQCRKCHTHEGNKVTRVSRSLSYVQFSHDNHKMTDCVVCHFPISNEDQYRPGVRSIVYPLPMEVCLSCHKERQATMACLDCHHVHHRTFPPTQAGPDWLRRISLKTVLLALLVLQAVVGASLFARWRANT